MIIFLAKVQLLVIREKKKKKKTNYGTKGDGDTNCKTR